MNETKTTTQIRDLEVIGQGGMVDKPCQVGEWWVMPAEQYTGKIPPDIQAKWDNFKALGIPVLGYLIADDMREVQLKWDKEAEEKREHEALVAEQLLSQSIEAKRQQEALEQQRRKEAFDKTVGDAVRVGGQVVTGIGKVLGAAAVGVGVLTAGVILTLLRFDPILIAVLPANDEYPSGRWVCLGAWWD